VVVAAAYTSIDKDGKVGILLGRRAPGYMYEGNWELFGGKVEPSDSNIRAGLEQELREETRLKLASIKGPISDVEAGMGDRPGEISNLLLFFKLIRRWVEVDGSESRKLELSKEHDGYGLFGRKEVDHL
jgi:8-oxo-dGTP pyrophosphatase MutT (NUDIX family)